ncbi:MAG: hypothetical protein JRC60_08510 [Deltaproteobacteria bacterium]|nr:hypothetical protein [Deltaproteobacteria bacterium]
MEYLTDDKRGEMFLKYIEHLNAMKLRALFVPERVVTQDVGVGSYGMAKQHAEIFIDNLEGLISDLLDHFNKYIVPQLVLYNFGESAPPAYIRTEGLRAKDKEFLMKVVEAVAKSEVLPVDLVKTLEQLDIPVKKEEGETTPSKRPKIPEPEEAELERKERTEYEKRVDFEGIKAKLDKAEGEFYRKASAVVTTQAEDLINQVKKALQEGTGKGYRDIGAVRKVKVRYQGDYKKLLKELIKDMYEFGKTTAKNELDVKEEIKTPASETQWILGRAEMLADKHATELKYITTLAVLNGLKSNKTNEDILFDIRKKIEAFRNKNVKTMASTEAMTALNSGRALIAKALA